LYTLFTAESREGADEANPTGSGLDNDPAAVIVFDVGADDASTTVSEPVGGVAVGVVSCASIDVWRLDGGVISIGWETATEKK